MQGLLHVGMVMAAGFGGMAGLAALGARLRLPPELSRKAMHVLTGLLALAFPWLFDFAWQALLATGGGLLVLLLARRSGKLRRHLLGAVDGVQQETHGVACFLAAIGFLFLFVGAVPLHYLPPLLVLTFADTAAALVGQSIGRRKLTCLGSHKTLEGSIAFAVIAAFCIYLPLIGMTGMGPSAAAGLAVGIALLAMLIEAVSGKGYDNLTVPISVLVPLRLVVPI